MFRILVKFREKYGSKIENIKSRLAIIRQINKNCELKAEIAKLRHEFNELKKELKFKKNHKFQTRCILGAHSPKKEI
jgi:hypothetical protein